MPVHDDELLLVTEVLVKLGVSCVQTNLYLSLREVVNPSEVLVIRRDKGHVPVVEQHLTLYRLLFVDDVADRGLLPLLDPCDDRLLGMILVVYVTLAHLTKKDSDNLLLFHTPRCYISSAQNSCSVECNPLLSILCLPNHAASKVEFHVVSVVVCFVGRNLSLCMLGGEVAKLLAIIFDDDVWVIRLKASSGLIDARLV